MLFALLGGTAPGDLAPWANGFALAVLIYITANISGGHLNPAVTVPFLPFNEPFACPAFLSCSCIWSILCQKALQ